MRTAWTTKPCVRCELERDHAVDDYMCIICRWESNHEFTRDGHTVSFAVGHGGRIIVGVTCPNTAGDENAPCWMRGNRWNYDRCLVSHEMHESGDPMDLLADPYGGDYEIASDVIPIEWYYHASEDQWDCEFGWRIADRPIPTEDPT